jgi:FKBP-type peptidyl-prolyl cis-trans isomerase FkpA/FKBP-type peptidyl-prolyl cis-trans isomerase FklB
MRKVVMLFVAMLLLAVAATEAAAPALDSEEAKTLYALGLALSREVASYDLSPADLELVVAGLADGVLQRGERVDFAVYGDKVVELQARRLQGSRAREQERFLERAAAAPGATRTPSGLIVTTIAPGTGPSPTAADTVRVHYHGTFTDGSVLDSSVMREEAVVLDLGRVMRCWSEGIQQMKVGGKSRLVCPAHLAFGAGGVPHRVPGGATIVYEVELLEIVK